MSIHAWRIVKRKHRKTAFSGRGAQFFGGRWNNPGLPLIYTAESQSLAALEMLVHLESGRLLLDQYIVAKVEIEESLVAEIDLSLLPRNWRADPPPARTRAMGDAWIRGGISAVLKVPSAILPDERLFLLNPRQPDFPRIVLGTFFPFRFDPRLAKLGV